jgi:hypothetical protein
MSAASQNIVINRIPCGGQNGGTSPISTHENIVEESAQNSANGLRLSILVIS